MLTLTSPQPQRSTDTPSESGRARIAATVSPVTRMIVGILAIVAVCLGGTGVPRAMATDGPTGTGEVVVDSGSMTALPREGALSSGMPSITTKAVLSGNKISEGATVVDTVTYTGLVPGKQYTLSGDLIDTADGKTQLGHGSMVFTPTTPDGEVENIIEIRADGPVPEAVVVESLYSTEVDALGQESNGSELIAQEKDLSNPNQTVRSIYSPSITTQAVMNKNQIVEGATVVDRVTYTDLVPGREYILRGQLVDKGDPTVILGTGERVFTPRKGDGDVTVPITVTVPGPVGAGVVFETLVSRSVDKEGKPAQGEVVIAEHTDLNDAAQTVTSELDPKITTEASLNSVEISKGVVVTDTVKYEDLIPGKKYTMYGVLVNPEDMTPAGLTQQDFVPEESDGELTMQISVAVDNPPRKLVVFEILKSSQVDKNGLPVDTETEIAAERDIENKKQTVTGRAIREEEKPAEKPTPEVENPEDAESEPGYSIHISAKRNPEPEQSPEQVVPDTEEQTTESSTPATTSSSAPAPTIEQTSSTPVSTSAVAVPVTTTPSATVVSSTSEQQKSVEVTNTVKSESASAPSTQTSVKSTVAPTSSVARTTPSSTVTTKVSTTAAPSSRATTTVQNPGQALAPKAQRVVITSVPSGPTGDLLNNIPEVIE